MNNAEHEPLISNVAPLPFEVQRPNKDAELASYRPATLLPEQPVKLSTWEQITLKVDATLQAVKFVGAMTPHIISIIWSYLMGNTTKLGVAIVGLIVAVLGHLGIAIPEQLVGVIDVLVALLIGWFIPSPKKATPTNE